MESVTLLAENHLYAEYLPRTGEVFVQDGNLDWMIAFFPVGDPLRWGEEEILNQACNAWIDEDEASAEAAAETEDARAARASKLSRRAHRDQNSRRKGGYRSRIRAPYVRTKAR